MMSPVNLDHARISGFLFKVLSRFVDANNLGEVLPGDFQVRLGGRQRQRRVPDVIFISKKRLTALRPTYLDGPPDLAVEVISPDSTARDYRDKYLAYQAAGVAEYWVVDPITRRLEVYSLGRGKRYQKLAEVDGKVESRVLRGFFIRPEWVLSLRLANPWKVLKEMGIRA